MCFHRPRSSHGESTEHSRLSIDHNLFVTNSHPLVNVISGYNSGIKIRHTMNYYQPIKRTHWKTKQKNLRHLWNHCQQPCKPNIFWIGIIITAWRSVISWTFISQEKIESQTNKEHVAALYKFSSSGLYSLGLKLQHGSLTLYELSSARKKSNREKAKDLRHWMNTGNLNVKLKSSDLYTLGS